MITHKDIKKNLNIQAQPYILIYYAKFFNTFELSYKEIRQYCNTNNINPTDSMFNIVLSYVHEIIKEIDIEEIRERLLSAFSNITLEDELYCKYINYLPFLFYSKYYMEKLMNICPNNLQYYYEFLHFLVHQDDCLLFQ